MNPKKSIFLITLILIFSISSLGASALLTDGLVYVWKFDDDAASTVLTESNQGADATLSANSDTLTTAGIDGKALNFTGNTDFAQLVGVDLTSNTSFTACSWFNPDDSLVGFDTMLGYFNDGNNRWNWDFETAPPIRHFNDNNSVSQTGFSLLNWHNNEWQFVCIASNQTHHIAYKNGVKLEQIDNTVGSFNGFTGSIEIARYGGAGNYFQGAIDEISMYDRMITSAEVLQLNTSFYPHAPDPEVVNIFLNQSAFPNEGLVIDITAQAESTPVTLLIDGGFSQSTSYWQTGHADQVPVWVIINMSQPSAINKTIWSAYSDTYEPTDFAVQGSNDSITWTNITRIEGNPSQANTTIHFSGGSGDNWLWYRMYVDSWNGGVSTAGGMASLEWQGFNLSSVPVIPPAGTVVNVQTDVSYFTVGACADGAVAGQTCMITDDGTYEENGINVSVANLTFKHKSTVGTPTVKGILVSEPVFNLGTSASGTYTIDGLHIVHSDGLGIVIDGATTQVTVTNNIFDLNASTGNNWGDGAANAVWMASGADHVIQNNTINLNGGLCCNYGIHVDAVFNVFPLKNINILDNTMTILGQGGFDGGINIYETATHESNVIISGNNIVVNTTGTDDAGFGLFVSGATNIVLQDNFFNITGRKGAAALWFDGTTTGQNVTILRDTYIVDSINDSFPSYPISSRSTGNLTVINTTMINNQGLADILSGDTGTVCVTQPNINVINPTWGGLISFFDHSTWFINSVLIQCGEAHVSYDVMVSTGVSGANILINSTNPDIQNPTNTIIGVADVSGDFSTSIGAFYANNASYNETPYLSFMPYNITASKLGYSTIISTETVSNGNAVVVLNLSLNVAPTTPTITSPTGSGNGDVSIVYSSFDPEDVITYRIFVDDEFITSTISTSFAHTFPTTGTYTIKVDAFDGLQFSGNGSGSYEVTGFSDDLPLEGVGNVVGMVFLLMIVVGLAVALMGGKK